MSNGYTNHETYMVSLWLANEGLTYRFCTGAGRQTPNARACGEAIREFVDDMAPEVEGLWADLHNLAMGRVDWTEVGEEYKPDSGWPDDIGEEE